MGHVDQGPDRLETFIEEGLDAQPASPFHKGYHERGCEDPHRSAPDVAREEFRCHDLLLVAFSPDFQPACRILCSCHFSLPFNVYSVRVPCVGMVASVGEPPRSLSIRCFPAGVISEVPPAQPRNARGILHGGCLWGP